MFCKKLSENVFIGSPTKWQLCDSGIPQPQNLGKEDLEGLSTRACTILTNKDLFPGSLYGTDVRCTWEDMAYLSCIFHIPPPILGPGPFDWSRSSAEMDNEMMSSVLRLAWSFQRHHNQKLCIQLQSISHANVLSSPNLHPVFKQN